MTSFHTVQRPAFIAFLVIFSVLSAILAVMDALTMRGSMEAPRLAPAANDIKTAQVPKAQVPVQPVQVPDSNPSRYVLSPQLILAQDPPCQV